MPHPIVRHLALTAALLAAMAGSATAQASNTSQSAQAPMSITLEPATLIHSSGSIEFGTVPFLPGRYYLSPFNPGPGQSVAQFTVPFLGTTNFMIDFPCSASLHGTTNVLAVEPTIAMALNDDPQNTAFDFTSVGYGCGGAYLAFSPDISQFVFWVGGTIQVMPDQQPGLYEGVYVVTVHLTGI